VIVVDASVLADALLLDGEAGERAAAALAADTDWAAPAHLLVEVLSVLRRYHLHGLLTGQRAGEVVQALRQVEVELVDPVALAERIWELKDNLSAYDAAYVAAAELLDVPLLTGDAKLAAAPGIRCQVIVPGAASS
jgi:predicted nucleic acid-binding protein